jgi:peptidoglycan/LPS O-acetylase OafA/YrhL
MLQHKMKRLFDIEILRAVGIILIVCSHLHYFINIATYQSIFENVSSGIALVGLSIFFFISGFSLYYNNKFIINIGDFYLKRLLRLYPLYFISLLDHMVLTNHLTMAIHLLGLQGIFYKSDGLLNWFIGVIFLYYLIYPFLITGNIWIKATIILLIFLSLRLSFDLINLHFFRYYGAFILGIIICKNNGEKSYHAAAVIIGILILILGTYLSLGIHTVSGISTVPYLFAITFFMLSILIPLICSHLAFKYAHRLDFAHKLISGIAFSSYPVYLFHNTLIMLYGLKVLAFIFIIGYCIQKLELSLKQKAIKALSP